MKKLLMRYLLKALREDLLEVHTKNMAYPSPGHAERVENVIDVIDDLIDFYGYRA